MNKREEVQNKAVELLNKYKKVLLQLPTGFGKTKQALDITRGKTLIIVPQINLIKSWEDEMDKWNINKDLFTIITYQSLSKYIGTYDTIILDEAHCITNTRLEYINHYSYGYLICLSGSVSEEKLLFLKQLGINKHNVIRVDTEEAVDEGIIAEFNINIIQCRLDNEISYTYDFGTKKTPNIKATTDEKVYKWLVNQYEYWRNRFFICKEDDKDYKFLAGRFKYFMQKRTNFLYNNNTKVKLAEQIIKDLSSRNERYLVFGGSIEQITSIE